jgi:hypothetical protein
MINYINTYYTIVWKHPEATESDWNTFLCEEDHENEAVKKTNGIFFSQLPNAILLLEAEEALKPTSYPLKKTSEEMHITAHLEPDRVFGWDMKDYTLLCDAPISALDTLLDLLRHFVNNKPKPLILRSIKTQLAHALQRLRLKRLSDGILEKLIDLKDEVLLKLAEEVDEFVKKELLPLEIEALPYKIAKKILKASICSSNNDIQNQVDIKLYNKAYKKVVEFRTQQQLLLIDKIDEFIKQKNYGIAKYFPIRTHSLVTTLRDIRSYIPICASNIVLIAGAHHLEEDPHLIDNSNFSLKELYDFLINHKNIVVLRPKNMPD